MVFGEVFIQRKQSRHGNARVYNIFVVIASVIPTLRRIDFRASRSVSRCCRVVDQYLIVWMACRSGKFASELRLKLYRSSLVVIPLDTRLGYRFVYMVFNVKRVRTADVFYKKYIRARLVEACEIGLSSFFLRILPNSCFL